MLTENEQARLLWLLACGHEIQFKISQTHPWMTSLINHHPRETRFDVILEETKKGIIYRIAGHVFPSQ